MKSGLLSVSSTNRMRSEKTERRESYLNGGDDLVFPCAAFPHLLSRLLFVQIDVPNIKRMNVRLGRLFFLRFDFSLFDVALGSFQCLIKA